MEQFMSENFVGDMALQWLLNSETPVLDLGLTIEDLMQDLDPGWNNWAPTSPAAAADVAALAAVLS